jgi:hypothetical protein
MVLEIFWFKLNNKFHVGIEHDFGSQDLIFASQDSFVNHLRYLTSKGYALKLIKV